MEWRDVMIVIGVDAHSQTHTAGAVNGLTSVELGVVTVPARPAGHEQLLEWARGLDGERVWGLEDCRTFTSALERFLLVSGERVVRVPPKLMAEVRKSARTSGKSDEIDAVAVARAAIREPGLPVGRLPGIEREIRLLVDHRENLLAECTRYQRRLRSHLHEIDPELQPPLRCLAMPANLAKLTRQLARRPQDAQVLISRELIRRIRELTKRVKQLQVELGRLVRRRCPALLALPGCGVLSAARILAEVEAIDRFPSEAHLAGYCGVKPLPASSGGQHRRHRLNRTGNRRLNQALYIIAITQSRIYPPARAYLARRVREGKNTREAIRALKRYIARTIYRILTTQLQEVQASAPVPGTAPSRCL
jgi:transposase